MVIALKSVVIELLEYWGRELYPRPIFGIKCCSLSLESIISVDYRILHETPIAYGLLYLLVGATFIVIFMIF